MLMFNNEKVHSNVHLSANTEISAIHMAAVFLSAQAQLDEQECLSSLLASEVLKTWTVSGRTAFIYATDPDLQHPQFMIMTFNAPIVWGADKALIDFLIVAVIPDQYTEIDVAAIAQAVGKSLYERIMTLTHLRQIVSP